IRLPLSPAMLWESFKTSRSEFNVSMVPVAVDDFLGQVPQPTDSNLKQLFTEYQKKAYDPTSPTPGFEIPTATRVELIIGDPASPKFKLWSKTAVLLQATPPAWIPYSPLSILARLGGGEPALKARLGQVYENIQHPMQAGEQ